MGTVKHSHTTIDLLYYQLHNTARTATTQPKLQLSHKSKESFHTAIAAPPHLPTCTVVYLLHSDLVVVQKTTHNTGSHHTTRAAAFTQRGKFHTAREGTMHFLAHQQDWRSNYRQHIYKQATIPNCTK